MLSQLSVGTSMFSPAPGGLFVCRHTCQWTSDLCNRETELLCCVESETVGVKANTFQGQQVWIRDND